MEDGHGCALVVYLRHLVTPHSLKLVVDHLAEKILADKAAGSPIDAIAVRGNSGTLVGGALSMATGIPVITIRKPGDNTHSSYRIECDNSSAITSLWTI